MLYQSVKELIQTPILPSIRIKMHMQSVVEFIDKTSAVNKHFIKQQKKYHALLDVINHLSRTCTAVPFFARVLFNFSLDVSHFSLASFLWLLHVHVQKYQMLLLHASKISVTGVFTCIPSTFSVGSFKDCSPAASRKCRKSGEIIYLSQLW